MRTQLISPTKLIGTNILGIVLILIIAVLLETTLVQAAPAPTTLFSAAPHFRSLDITHYQFRGTNATGGPISDGSHTVVFSIWDDSSGGTSLWNETQLITTTDGLGSAQIGSLVPIPLSVLSLDRNDSTSSRFLQVEIDGEVVQPRTRLVGTPYANISERVLGDVVTAPGLLEITPNEELVGSYNFLLENSNDDGAHLVMESPFADTGISFEVNVSQDSTGDYVATMGFYGTTDDVSRPRSSKPKEIVVVGSKVKEVVRFYENAFENEVATREHVSGRATGRRTYPPFRVIGAQLPDTVPAFDLSVDSNGTVMSMSKNNTDGSSCWVRVSTASTASHELHAANAGSSSSKTEESSPRGTVMYLDVTETAANSAQVNEYVSVDSGYGQTTTLVSGSSQTQTGNMMDFQEIINSYSATDGTDSTVIKIGANESSAISSLRTLVSSQAMFHETKLDSSGSSWLLQSEDIIIARAGKRLTKAEIITELTSSSSSNEFSDDDNNTIVQTEATTTSSKLFVGGLSWDAVAGEDGVEVRSTNGRKTVRAHDFMASTTDTGAVFELAAADDEATMYLGSGDSGFDGAIEASVDSIDSELRIRSSLSNGTYAGMYSDASSNSLRFSQILPSRAIADVIAMEQTSTSSKLYVGNLGFGSNDGFNVSASPAGGTLVGIGTNAPGVALHVVGSICYTGGITSCSDGRYKEDIETIDNALDVIEHLRGVEYKWKKDDYPDMRFGDGQQLGLVAQEVKEVVPSLVTEDANGYYSVDYVKLTPLLIEAIKAQQKTIEELEQRVADKDELDQRIKELEKLVSAILQGK